MEDDDVIYTIGFYPTEQKMDGSYHSLSVKVARKGVEVHHRQGYLADDTKIFTPKQRREAMTDGSRTRWIPPSSVCGHPLPPFPAGRGSTSSP